MPAERDRRLALHRGCLVLCAGLVLGFNAPGLAAQPKPQRIVSINVCTDQLLLTLVERDRIASLSHLAADPYSSWIGDAADGFYLNRGIAEEVIALDPDLVVTVAFSFRPTVTILKRLGYPVVELEMASSLKDIENSLLTLAEAVGEMERADGLIGAFRSEIEALTYRGSGGRPLFVSYEADGWTTGFDSLVADVARAAGFDTVGDRLGFSGGRTVSLEELLLLRPDLVDLGHPWDHPPALVSESLRHPALSQLLEETPRVEIPDPLWICGSTRTLDALAILSAARAHLDVPATAP